MKHDNEEQGDKIYKPIRRKRLDLPPYCIEYEVPSHTYAVSKRGVFMFRKGSLSECKEILEKYFIDKP